MADQQPAIELVTHQGPAVETRRPSQTLYTEQPAQAAAAAPAQPVKSAAGPSFVSKLNWFTILTLLFQLGLIVLFGCCTVFDGDAAPWLAAPTVESGVLAMGYTMFQQTWVMMLIGFGFLYVGMRNYAWTGVSWTFFISALGLQWGILCQGFWERVYHATHSTLYNWASIEINLYFVTMAAYLVATVLVSYGAVIGRVSLFQMLFVVFFETIIAAANVVIGFNQLMVTDPGGSMYIHTFGASFGLALSLAIGDKSSKSPSATRHNATMAMIGTLFLFMFWPSFNAALLTGTAQMRAVYCTLISICVSCVVTFALSSAINKRKFTMEDIQNATIAGGVAIGAACNMLTNVWGAAAVGFVAGAISTLGFNYASAFLKRKIGLSDTCGIFNLHFMPGILGGIASAVAAAGLSAGTTPQVSGSYPAQFNPATFIISFPGLATRTAVQQGGFQMAVVCISLVLGLGSGAICGFIVKLPFFQPPKEDDYYLDDPSWVMHIPEEERVKKDE